MLFCDIFAIKDIFSIIPKFSILAPAHSVLSAIWRSKFDIFQELTLLKIMGIYIGDISLNANLIKYNLRTHGRILFNEFH